MHFKQITQIAVIFSILLFCFSNIAYANNAIILEDHLNVREGPGKDYDTIDRVHSDEEYSVIQQENDWVEIQLNDTTGWVSSEYVSIDEESDESDSSEKSHTNSITIPTDNTQVRSGPSTDDDILFFAKEGMDFDVVSEEENWYEIEIEENSGYVNKNLITNSESFEKASLNDKHFVIDAGHGGYDVGAISINDHYEKDITFKTAVELKNALTNLGANVYLTRSNDEFIRLGSRVSSANLLDPDAFISIHYNSFDESPNASGIGSYYYHEDDQALANAVQDEVIQMTGAKDREAILEDYQVLRHNKNPALLLELGFISNEEEADLLITDAYQKTLVQGIVNGLVKHYSKDK